jgi:recombination associated protein RdgC
MWFRNLRVYRLAFDSAIDATQLGASLASNPLARCGSFDMQSRGWVYPHVDGEFVHEVNRHWLLALGVEQKLLPATVIRQVAQERAAQIEAEQARKLGRKELRDIRDQVTDELMPKALTCKRTTWGWIDPQNSRLLVDAGSDARADEFVESLAAVLGPASFRLLHVQESPSAAMTGWLAAGDPPSNFSIDRDLELKATGAADAAIRYVRHDLEGKEIQAHIAAGKVVTKLGLTWNDRISFVLNDAFQIKRIGFLDSLKEEAAEASGDADERFDADFTLMTGELALMLSELISALGGERIPT